MGYWEQIPTRCGYPSRLRFFALHPKADPPLRRARKKQRLELQVCLLGEVRVLVIRPCDADFPRNQKLPRRKRHKDWRVYR